MRPAKVCICKGVSEKQIVEAVMKGADTLEKIALVTRATTGCGTCRPKVDKILQACLAARQTQ